LQLLIIGLALILEDGGQGVLHLECVLSEELIWSEALRLMGLRTTSSSLISRISRQFTRYCCQKSSRRLMAIWIAFKQNYVVTWLFIIYYIKKTMKTNKIDSYFSDYEKMIGEDLSGIEAARIDDGVADDPDMARL
jgi:hypothetical protein